MKQKSICLLLAFAMVLQAGCVHVSKSDETHSIKEQSHSQLQKAASQGVDLDYVIYRTSTLPLGDFFTRLKRGEFKKAFQQVDFRYRSSNFDDRALNKLIDAGFVPVYVKVKNTSQEPLEIDEKSFLLTNEKMPKAAFYSDQLPKAFSEIDASAVAANVYNTGVVVIGFAAVLAILVVAGAEGFPAAGAPGTSGGPGDSDPVYNDVYTNVRVNYKDYLISKKNLQPGDEAKGLLFFSLGEADLVPDSKLLFQSMAKNPQPTL